MTTAFFLCNQTFTYQGKRSRKFEASKKYSQTQVFELPPSVLSTRFTQVVKNSSAPRQSWSIDEYISVIELYLKHFDKATGFVDYDLIYADHSQVYPDRLFNSVKKQAYVIQSRDVLCPQVGLQSCAQEVAEGLNALDAERFPLEAQEIELGKLITSARLS